MVAHLEGKVFDFLFVVGGEDVGLNNTKHPRAGFTGNITTNLLRFFLLLVTSGVPYILFAESGSLTRLGYLLTAAPVGGSVVTPGV